LTKRPVFEKADVEERFLGIGLFHFAGLFLKLAKVRPAKSQ